MVPFGEKSHSRVRVKRIQFPLRLGYAGTADSVLGLTATKSIVDFRRDFWSHGQSFMSMSRSTESQNTGLRYVLFPFLKKIACPFAILYL